MTTKSTGLPRGIYEKVSDSGVYWIRYTDLMGKERREKCGTLKAAKKRLEIRKGERAEGRQTTMEPKHLKFGILIDDAFARVKAESVSTHNIGNTELIYNIIRADFGDMLVANIKTQNIADWLQQQKEKRGWKNSSLNRYQAAFSKIFHVAVINEKTASNPASKISRRRENNARVRALTVVEEKQLMRVVEERFPEYAPAVSLAIHTGMRASEQLRVCVGDVDFTGSVPLLTIHQQKAKAAPPVRHVPMTSVALAAYEQLAKGKSRGDKLHSKTVAREGGDLDLKSMRYWFDQCTAAAGVPDFSWHDLRHTFATRMVSQGVPLTTVKEYMGHQSVQMTARYSHLIPGSHEQAAAAMMAAYGPKKRPAKAAASAKATGTFGIIRGGKH